MGAGVVHGLCVEGVVFDETPHWSREWFMVGEMVGQV
jgi:hypothetical protein